LDEFIFIDFTTYRLL